MPLTTFTQWFENLEASRMASRDMLLAYFRQKLNIKDDQAILDMPLDEIDDAVKALRI